MSTYYKNGKTVKFKSGVLEYNKKLGWCYLKPGEEMCTVVYLYNLKDVKEALKDET